MAKRLSTNWFIEGTMDFEYKKYILLAYLQQVSQNFSLNKLYPDFSELIFHYNNLLSFQTHKQAIKQRFPKKLDETQLKNLSLTYHSTISENDDIQLVNDVIEYAIPTIKGELETGKEIYEYIEKNIQIEPVGIMPIYKNEGYLFLRINLHKVIQVFQYKITFFENTEANYHGISLKKIADFPYSLADTYESIKLELIRHYKELPNPATYLVYVDKPFPRDESLIPVTKRKFLAYMK